MKRLIILATAFISLGITGCLKDSPNNDFSKLGVIVEMPYSGKGFFGSDAVTDAEDTVVKSFTINIASPNVLSTATSVTVAVIPDMVAEYNAYDPSVVYEVLPDSCYSFDAAPITIPAGSRLDTMEVTFFKSKIDPTKSYMLPLAIKDASGHTISGNMGVHYYHFIGNPLAGPATWDYVRWNNGTGSGAPTTTWTGESTVFLPDDPTTIEVNSGYGDQNGINYRYVLSFTNTNGVLSDFQLKMNADDVASFGEQGISLTGGPTIITADPATGTYKFSFQVFNGTANRFFNDTYHK